MSSGNEWNKLSLPTVVAAIAEGTLGAARLRPLAQFLTVVAEQLVCSDQRIVVLG